MPTSSTDATVSVLSDALKESVAAPGGDEEEQLVRLEKEIADTVSEYLACLKNSLYIALSFSVMPILFTTWWLILINMANTLEQNATLGGTGSLAPVLNIPAIGVSAQTIGFASLAAALYATFIMVFGKLWILDYTRVTSWGNVVDRVKERQVKLMGLKKRGFRLVTVSSLMAEFAAILFWIAFTVCVWDSSDYFLRAITIILLVVMVTIVGVTIYMRVVVVV